MENTFLVTPMSQNINLKPGEVYSGSITISNPASSVDDFNYSVSVSPYSVIGENYDADLATVSNRSMIKDWIKIDKPAGILKPNESKKINFTITVPQSAPAGGQYAAITVMNNSSSSGGNGVAVNSVFEIASLIYANVAGEIVREGEILENNIPGFVMNTPVTLTSLFSNSGNVHQIATAIIGIKNVLTGEQILPDGTNDSIYNELIMPETERLVTYNIADLPVVGVVEISQVINYNGNSSIETKNVIICPVWFMLLIFVMLIGSIWAILAAIKKYRRKKSII